MCFMRRTRKPESVHHIAKDIARILETITDQQATMFEKESQIMASVKDIQAVQADIDTNVKLVSNRIDALVASGGAVPVATQADLDAIAATAAATRDTLASLAGSAAAPATGAPTSGFSFGTKTPTP